jgi:N-acetylglutamate synthase-like GNAT family acetyltransferase
MEYIIRKIENNDREKVKSLIRDEWGSEQVISRGKIHHVSTLNGFLAVSKQDKSIVGILTMSESNNECEIVTMNSFLARFGIGTSLLDHAIENARQQNCSRVWLVSTNDNIEALRFYQKRGFDIKAVHRNALTQARKFKPEIPEYGNHGIPVMHEIEMEICF